MKFEFSGKSFMGLLVVIAFSLTMVSYFSYNEGYARAKLNIDKYDYRNICLNSNSFLETGNCCYEKMFKDKKLVYIKNIYETDKTMHISKPNEKIIYSVECISNKKDYYNSENEFRNEFRYN